MIISISKWTVINIFLFLLSFFIFVYSIYDAFTNPDPTPIYFEQILFLFLIIFLARFEKIHLRPVIILLILFGFFYPPFLFLIKGIINFMPGIALFKKIEVFIAIAEDAIFFMLFYGAMSFLIIFILAKYFIKYFIGQVLDWNVLKYSCNVVYQQKKEIFESAIDFILPDILGLNFKKKKEINGVLYKIYSGDDYDIVTKWQNNSVYILQYYETLEGIKHLKTRPESIRLVFENLFSKNKVFPLTDSEQFEYARYFINYYNKPILADYLSGLYGNIRNRDWKGIKESVTTHLF